MVHELERHAGVGQHGLEDGDAVEEVEDRCGETLGDLRVGKAVDEQRRVAPGDDTGAENVGVGRAPPERRREQLLDLGLLRGVGVGVGPARGHVLGERLRVVAVKAVRRDR